MTTIAVLNQSSVLTDDQIKAALPAFQQQITDDFAPVWGPTATLEWVDKGAPVPAGAWEAVLLDNSDQAEALGYHDLTAQGLPLAKIFAKSDAAAGLSWTVTVSHELLEMLGDPNICLMAQVYDTQNNLTGYAFEACDACEGDQFGYEINGTVVSDFVTPNWFTPGTPGPYDFKGHITQPLELLTDGYIGVWTPTGGWTQKTDAVAGARYSARPSVGARRERRRTPRHQWLASKI